MLGVVPSALDISSLRQLACTALVLLAGVLFLVKKAASRYFVVDTGFGGTEGCSANHRMPIGGGGGDAGGGVLWECAVCSRSANKRCSRCKSVRYCSQVCQSEHWEAGHKTKCRQARSLDNFVTCGTPSRRNSSSISLIPHHSTRKLLKEPKTFLFPYDEFVKLFDWDKPGFPPCGLINCGNSCFANVVLQCLTCTRPLVAYFLEKNHSRGCLRRGDDWCFLCELQIHIKRSSGSTKPFSPVNILSRLPNIGGNLGYGRQEDAHEFMRFAIDTMQSICLEEYGGEKAVDPGTQETTIVQYIFGGHLQSQVICTKCDLVSNRYENMMDLTVEIQGGAECLEECLNQFTAKEWLDGENMYKCDGCNDYVKAWKQLTVHQAPNVLTIALKRFQSGRFGKLKKRVTFPENLNLTPYMSANGDNTDQYILYGVVVHLDMLNSSFFGHYICYIKDYQGLWYKIDDCKVMNVEVEEVLAQGAYMLLYHRRNPRKEPFVKPTEPTVKYLSEADRETSITQGSTDYSACVISSMPQNTEPLHRPKSSHPEILSDLLMLRDTGHDRLLEEKLDSSNEKESKHIDLDATAILTYPDLGLTGELGMDRSLPSPTEVKDVEFDSYLSKDASSIKPILSKTFSPTKFCLTVGEATECREQHSCSDANLDMGRNVPVDVRVMPEQTLVDNDIIMEEMSTAPIPTSSSDQSPPLAIKPESEPAARNCVSSGLANGICRRDTSLDCKRPNEVWEDGSRVKSKTIFTRGFLNSTAQKKPAKGENASQTKIHRAPLLPLDDEYSNGHLMPFSNIKMANGEAATRINVSENGGEISPVSERTSLSHFPE